MEENTGLQKDIESIRKLMERSTKFISLSGLSGILAGCYALIGAALAARLLDDPMAPASSVRAHPSVAPQLALIAAGVLFASIVTGVWMSINRSQKVGARFWNSTTQRMVVNLAIPLVAGGIFIIILILRGNTEIVASASLIFYGLALINASQNLYDEVRYLGYSEIILGLATAVLARYDLIGWAIGFGAFHIFYGALMYRKYE